MKIFLPEIINTVPGDTLEIFYRSITNVANIANYHWVAIAAKGTPFMHKWVYTPLDGDPDFILQLTVYDDDGNTIAQSQSQIHITRKIMSAARSINVLCLGDSLTAGGEWVTELQRRLCQSGGTPAGDGLTNINFIGSCGITPARFEAYGGWNWASYLCPGSVNRNTWIYPLADITIGPEYQHSVWTDERSNPWQLETIDTDLSRFKFKPGSESTGTDELPPEGALYWSSGASFHSRLDYTATQPEKGNPLWCRDELSFKKYLLRNGIAGGIDICYILLGWNDHALANTAFFTADYEPVIAAARQLIDLLHREYPDCQIVLISPPPPEPDGSGSNYGCTSPKWSYLQMMTGLLFLSQAYQQLTQEKEYCSFTDYVNIACQFDVATGAQYTKKPINNRSRRKVLTGINGLHPATAGYLMIADAIYRNIHRQLVKFEEVI